jgi:dTDP-4-amino-4,6-dideoxygalactose transaminase
MSAREYSARFRALPASGTTPLLKAYSTTLPRVARNEFLAFSPPYIGEEEIAAVVATLRSHWITTGHAAHAFEEEFAASVEAPAALAVNSCTAALHLALLANGVGPGDEVITTTMTFVATANVVEHVGARLVLVDVEPDTLNLDPARFAAAITPRTRAIIVVHYGGHPAEMDAIRQIAQAHDIAIIEDAAHAVAASYRGRPIGSGDNLTAFSFYATKNLTTAEGGMLTGPPQLIDRARILSLHGMNRDAWRRYDREGSWFYEVEEVGFKYNMPDVLASIGRVQLSRLDAAQRRREAIVDQYRLGFDTLEALELPTERPEVRHAWHLFAVRLRPGTLSIDRNRLIEELRQRNIGSSVHFIPVHMHAYYRERYGWTRDSFPVALDSYERIVSLPLHPGLINDETWDVISAMWDIVKLYGR